MEMTYEVKFWYVGYEFETIKNHIKDMANFKIKIQASSSLEPTPKTL